MPVYAEKELVDGQKRWYIRTYTEDEFGNKKQITRHNKSWIGREGKKEAEQEEVRLKNASTIIEKIQKKNTTVAELKKIYLESLVGKIDNDTLRAKEIKLNHFCEIDITNQVSTYPNQNINKITKKNYEKWQQEMKKKTYLKGKKEKHFSTKRLISIHNEICSMFDFGIINGFLTENVAKQCGSIVSTKEIKMANIKTSYVTIDYNEYLDLMEASKDDLKYNTYFDLEFCRGPRTGEVRAFRVLDYFPEKKQLKVNHTMSKKNELKDPKTASSKDVIDLDDKLNEKIKLLIDDLKKQEGFSEEWYIFNGKTPISEHALRYATDKYFKLANIKKHIRLHDFRHSCATWLFSIGIPITVISKILRHANISETMKTYTHLIDDDYTCSLAKISEFKFKNLTQKI